MKIIKGITVKEKLLKEKDFDLEFLKKHNKEATLETIRVGDNPPDISYERSIIKQGADFNIKVKRNVLAKNATMDAILSVIDRANRDDKIDGIMMFRPLLSPHLDQKLAENFIIAEKDVDGITRASIAGTLVGDDESKVNFPPCTARAVIETLEKNNIEIEGSNIAVLGRSMVVGRALALMLTDKNATVTICHSKTKNLQRICKSADIIVSAMGRLHIIDKDFVSPGQIIIDVGVNEVPGGGVSGDVDFDKVKDIVRAITPVPGGIGMVTSSVLFCHIIEAAVAKVKKKIYIP